MPWYRILLQPFYTAWVLLLFLACLLVTTPIVALLALGNSPRARRAIWRLLRGWAFGFLALIGMPIRRLGTRPGPDRVVAVLNHISYIDSVVLLPAMPGYFRPLGKKEMSRIPLFGFIYKQLVLMVDRESAHSRARSMRLMSRALRQECSIAVFPEGTFNETDAPLKTFFDGAFRLAIDAQRPILPILLPDTVHRWHYSAWWKLWPGRNRVVYLDPVPTQGLTQADLPALKEQVWKLMAQELGKFESQNSKVKIQKGGS